MLLVVNQIDQAVRLAGGASAEISDQGRITIMQDSTHAVELTPEQAYEIVVWLVEHHLGYLDFKAHEPTQQEQICFECREPIDGPAFVYQLDEGDIELCGYCHTDVAQTVVQLQ